MSGELLDELRAADAHIYELKQELERERAKNRGLIAILEFLAESLEISYEKNRPLVIRSTEHE